MAIETIQDYNQKYQLPVYTEVALPEHNDYELGEKYDIRVEDSERQKEKGGKGPYNYIHESILIAKRRCLFGELEDVTLAFNARTQSRNEAVKDLSPGEPLEDDREVVLLVFLRLDKVEGWVMGDFTPIDPDNPTEAQEGNG